MPKRSRKIVRRAKPRFRVLARNARRGLTSPNRMYKYVQTVNGLQISNATYASRYITQTNAAQTFFFFFTLADLVQGATFAGLYDQFKIDKVILRFVPMCNTNDVVNSATAGNPGIIATVIDYDPNGVATTLNSFEEFATFKFHPTISAKSLITTIHPKISNTQTYDSRWVPTLAAGSPTNVPYYGIRMYVDAYSGATVHQQWQIFATYYLSFRNVN